MQQGSNKSKLGLPSRSLIATVGPGYLTVHIIIHNKKSHVIGMMVAFVSPSDFQLGATSSFFSRIIFNCVCIMFMDFIWKQCRMGINKPLLWSYMKHL